MFQHRPRAVLSRWRPLLLLLLFSTNQMLCRSSEFSARRLLQPAPHDEGSSSTHPSNISLVAGYHHTCVLVDNFVKCWGRNDLGQLGLEDKLNRGVAPGQMGDHLPTINFGMGNLAVALSAGGHHTCAVFQDHTLRCWGANDSGQLGLGDVRHRGDEIEEMGRSLPLVDLGSKRKVSLVSAGYAHTCAVLDNGQLKCWGQNIFGQLGLGDTVNRGDKAGTMGDDLPSVRLGTGKVAVTVSASRTSWGGYTCAVMTDNSLKCWGDNNFGKLGLGDANRRGDEAREMGDRLPEVDVGTGKSVVSVSTGHGHTCALLNTTQLKCWGNAADGQLGQWNTRNRGDEPEEMGNNLRAVNVGRELVPTIVGLGEAFTCAVLDTDAVKCWGANHDGQLGLGDTRSRGSLLSEMGNNLQFVDIGSSRGAKSLAVGCCHTCVVLDDATVKCWGKNDFGQLGLGDQLDRGSSSGDMGDDLLPVELGSFLFRSYYYTLQLTSSPTTSPTQFPTNVPTNSRTASPTSPTIFPTQSPSGSPTRYTTTAPTKLPTSAPTFAPPKSPKLSPTSTQSVPISSSANSPSPPSSSDSSNDSSIVPEYVLIIIACVGVFGAVVVMLDVGSLFYGKRTNQVLPAASKSLESLPAPTEPPLLESVPKAQ